ncbi:MAG: orotidine-5'-phosphate decarboxylase [Candidatus Gracilibacteria bacterium]
MTKNTPKAAREFIIKAYDSDLPDDRVIAMEELSNNIESFLKYASMLKFGMKNITKFGPDIVNMAKKMGYEVFYDMKFFDISNSVGEAVYEATKLGVKMINVHAIGCKKMMIAAIHGREVALQENPKLKRPILLAVTVLTSISQDEFNNEIGIPGSIADTVLRYSISTAEVGFDGVVCSGQEVKRLRNEPKIPNDFILVTPGIRQKGGSDDDQERITTPTVAIKDGSNFLVVGRPIKSLEGAQKVFQEVTEAIN